MKVCLVGSSGGHLTHLYMLKPFWKDKERFWITFDKEDSRSLLEGEKMYPCYYPTNRSLKALIINTKIISKVISIPAGRILLPEGLPRKHMTCYSHILRKFCLTVPCV